MYIWIFCGIFYDFSIISRWFLNLRNTKYHHPEDFFFQGPNMPQRFLRKSLDRVCFLFHPAVRWDSKPQLPARHLSCVLGLQKYEKNLFCWVILSNLSCVFRGNRKIYQAVLCPMAQTTFLQPRYPPNWNHCHPKNNGWSRKCCAWF